MGRKKKNLKFSQMFKRPLIFLKPIPIVSEAELKKYFEDIMNKDFQDKYDRKMVITRFCKTHGVVTDDGSPLMNYCSDPTCFNCNQFHELLAEEAKNFLK